MILAFLFMIKSSKYFIQSTIFLFLLYTYSCSIVRKINLTVTDLGRHLKNGELFIHNFSIPAGNLYSYTCPDYPFINHHWGSGVIFYLIKTFSGFNGLSIFIILISIATLFLFFHVAWKYSSFEIAALVAVIAIPTMASRFRIRPEVFSYFFCALFFWILYNWKNKRIKHNFLILLPILEILWGNLHIYFFIGIILIGIFLLDCLIAFFIHKSKETRVFLKQISVVFIFSIIATLLNPATVKGALYPFKILVNFGIDTFDLQSVYQLRKVIAMTQFDFPPLFYFSLIFNLFLLSWVFVLIKLIKRKAPFPFIRLALSIIFSFMALTAVRNFAIFGYFALPIIAINLRSCIKKDIDNLLGYLIVFLLVILIFFCLFLAKPQFWPDKRTFGIGLEKGTTDAINLFQNEKIQGPVFNNFDTGGYLTYYLYPQQRVFIDNRPEAYPLDLKNTYLACQKDDTQWERLRSAYNFNVIFFSPHVNTPWGQSFLLRRLLDPLWAPVYVDDYFIIFLRRKGPNQGTIEKYELPKDIFFPDK
ncbi:MAG: hypothetical protein PHF69_00835 [Candidatus Omnitrophica bacterium]|nr:hypothetical protein [Candidatus Omnitrophota bacterium]